jgi:hypothetical protein
MKQQQQLEAWNLLKGIDKRYYTSTGFYALGDAYILSGKNPQYKNQAVLVEHRGKLQVNHWDWTCELSECKCKPTITTNGDDGECNLKRKAESLKVSI